MRDQRTWNIRIPTVVDQLHRLAMARARRRAPVDRHLRGTGREQFVLLFGKLFRPLRLFREEVEAVGVLIDLANPSYWEKFAKKDPRFTPWHARYHQGRFSTTVTAPNAWLRNIARCDPSRSLNYVEGYVWDGASLREHAWVTRNGKLIDLLPLWLEGTSQWRERKNDLGLAKQGWEFLGVPLPSWLNQELWCAGNTGAVLPRYDREYGAWTDNPESRPNL